MSELELKQLLPELHHVKYHGNTLFYRTFTKDIRLIRQIIVGVFDDGRWHREYDIDVDSEICDGMLDLGANIGLNTIKYADQYPHMKIVAVEPENGNYDVLLKNTTQFPNVVAVRAGVWYKQTKLTIEDPGKGSWGFIVKEGDSGLQGVSIDELCKKYKVNPSIVKMDIEGSEMVIFEHINETIWIDKVQILMIETHDWLAPGCDRLIRDTMRDRGFSEERNGGIYVFRRKNRMP